MSDEARSGSGSRRAISCAVSVARRKGCSALRFDATRQRGRTECEPSRRVGLVACPGNGTPAAGRLAQADPRSCRSRLAPRSASGATGVLTPRPRPAAPYRPRSNAARRCDYRIHAVGARPAAEPATAFADDGGRVVRTCAAESVALMAVGPETNVFLPNLETRRLGCEAPPTTMALRAID